MDILFYGMMRAGKHAIIFWILNNVGHPKSVLDTRVYLDKENELLYINDLVRTNFIRDTTETKPIIEKYRDYKNRFVSFEDDYIDVNTTFIGNILDNIGVNNRKIFIIRDVLNNYCSRKKMWGQSSDYAKNTVVKWKAIYKKYLDLKERGENVILINYNQWLTSKEYRYKLATILGFTEYVDNIDYVPEIGNGSSFVKVHKDTTENYLQRYKKVELSDEEKNMLLDDELVNMNRDLFGLDLVEILQG